MLTNTTRSHLIQDLQPYTCTAPICPEGDNKPLNTWEEWLVHEQVHHRMEYICSHHPTQSFLSREQYIDHIESVHSDRKDELLKSQEIDKHAQLTPKPTNGCPLCFYTADNWPDMDKHLGFHLETLSLLGLPLATGLEKDNEEMASLQLEGGGNNSELEILEDDATEDEYKEAELDQDGTHMPPGERITLNSLAKLQEQTLAARNGREAVAELLRDMSSAGINTDDGERDDESDIKSDKEPSYGSLLLAAEEGDETVVRLLLETSKADFDAQDRHGRTPLCLAAQGGHDVIVKLLLDTGSVIIDSRDYGGRTPLSWASANGHEGIVKQLLATARSTRAQ